MARSFAEAERLASQARQAQTAHQQLAEAQKKQPDLIRRAKEDFLKHDGKLSDAMYREIEQAGFGTKADIDGLMDLYAREQAALYDQANTAIFRGSLDEALAFAHSDAMPEKARERIDALMDDPDTMEIGLFALKGMYEHHAAGNPTAVLQWGDPPRALSGDVFASEDEYLKATEDPKYGKDREFTAAVDAKMQRSTARWKK